jgi:hypothetical protein
MDVLEGTGAKVPVAMSLPSRVFCRLTVYKKKQVLALQKFQLQAKRSWGFHPCRCGSPDAITPEQVLRPHRSAQSGMGGQALSPPSSFQHLEFHINGKGILQSQNN